MTTYILTFTKVLGLSNWLVEKKKESGDDKEFYRWLQDFFKAGNYIQVLGQPYDYQSCVKLL